VHYTFLNWNVTKSMDGHSLPECCRGSYRQKSLNLVGGSHGGMIYEMRDDLECPVCRSPALVYPSVLEDNYPVTCSRCGAFAFTYGELKQRVEQALSSYPRLSPISGC
jgi:hypothetical protein